MELTRQNDPHALRNRLLACNDDVDKMDRNGNTALLIAAQNGYFTCLDLLLNEGHANYKLINVFGGFSCDQQQLDFDSILYLLHSGTGQNALTLATFAGSEACVRLLLSKWTYERFSKRCLTPPLCVAALKGHMELVRWFCGMYPGPEHIHTAHGASFTSGPGGIFN